jgi:DNA-binding NarL/FixJ family response regulator
MRSRPRILIADDHAAVRAWLIDLLSGDCDVVGSVSDGADVAAAAARLQPVVIVVDLSLPTRNGLDVCREIARTDVRAKTIVFTAFADDDALEEEARQAGAAGFLSKATATRSLIPAIRQIWAGL